MAPPPLLLLCAVLLAGLLQPAAAAREDACGPAEKCVSLLRCPAAMQGLRQLPQRRPTHCGFADSTTRVPDVCCGQGTDADDVDDDERACPAPAPPLAIGKTAVWTCEQISSWPRVKQTGRPGDLARKMCMKHQEDLCALPKQQLYNVACGANGVLTDILEYPHMALIGYGEGDKLQFACGGSLIAPDFILTAAHCARLSGEAASWVLLGSTNRTSSTPKANDTHQLIQVAEVIVHPEYVGNLKYHDIALLRLSRPARVTAEEVNPACLDTDIDTDITGKDAVATGWGATGYLEDASASLIKVSLTVRKLQYCTDNVDLERLNLPRGLDDDTQLCAGGGEDNQDTCQGDSGGPLQVPVALNLYTSKPCVYRIIGVVSFGPPCGLGKPGIYTKVAAYVPWIESVVWPTSQDGCSKFASLKFGNRDVQIPNTGPGSVARGVCRAYHVEFCNDYLASSTPVRPGLSRDNACHHGQPDSESSADALRTTVTFRYGDSQHNYQYACAGALVSPDTVLTAARCAALGCVPLTHATLQSPWKCGGVTILDVQSVIVHPDYQPGRAYADLAVVKLSESVDLRRYFPLCLNTPTELPVQPGVRATAAGWNAVGKWNEVLYSLSNNTVTVRAPKRCATALLGSDRLRSAFPDGYKPSLMCAGGLCDNEVYAGEPGTPLTSLRHGFLAPNGGPYRVDYVLGVASSLTYCTARDAAGRRLPDLFADVAQHIAWIERTVWPEGEARDP